MQCAGWAPARWLRVNKPRLAFAAVSYMYDETAHNLRVCTGSAKGQAGTIDIIAGRYVFQRLEAGILQRRFIEPLSPPFTVPAPPSASLCVWGGGALRCPPVTAPLLEFKRALLDCAVDSGGLAFDIDQTDNVSGNDRYFNAACMVDPPGWLKAQRICMNHQKSAHDHFVKWRVPA